MSPNASPSTATPVTHFYALLTGDEDARACREQPASFIVHLVSSLATKAGAASALALPEAEG